MSRAFSWFHSRCTLYTKTFEGNGMFVSCAPSVLQVYALVLRKAQRRVDQVAIGNLFKL